MPIVQKSEPLSLLNDEFEDDNEQNDQPRFLKELPFCGTLLSYGGEDGDITGRKANSTEPFKIVQRYDDNVRAVAVSKDAKRIAVGFDDGRSMIYVYDDNAQDKDLHPFCEKLDAKNDSQSQDDFFNLRSNSFIGPEFELPIRDLHFIQDTYILALATESGLVLVDVTDENTLSDRSLQHQVQEHHNQSGIRGVDSHGSILASLAMDGRLCIWDTQEKSLLERETTSCIPKKDVGEIHGADAFDRSCRPYFFQPDSGPLVLATPGLLQPTLRRQVNDASTFETVSLENMSPDKGHVETIVAIQFLSRKDKDATYFVTSGRDCRVILWKWADSTKLTPLETFTLPSVATSLLVSKDDPSRVFAASSRATLAIVDLEPHFPKTNTGASTLSKKPSVGSKKSILDDESDDESIGEQESTPSKSTSRSVRVRFVDDEAAEDDDLDDDNDIPAASKTSDRDGAAILDDDDDDLDDMGPTGTTVDDLQETMNDLDYDMPRFEARAKVIPPQPAFSPSSTPLDLARRFLCWNSIGSITLLQGDTLNTVDISFTDSAFKRPVSFTDNMNFILGSLGADGAIFATDLQDDNNEDDDEDDIGLDGLKMSEQTKRAVRKSQRKGGSPTGSSIFFYRFDTFGNPQEKDWYTNLPNGELVLGAATGAGWAAVATSRKFLRFYSSGGNPGQIAWLKGDPVTMVGSGRFLAVVYHDTVPLQDGSQKLAYTLWDATSFEVLSEGPLSCLGKGASLTWAGFSNDFSFMAMDSEGMLSMLVPTGGSQKLQWIPVLDTLGLRKSKEDSFWPVSVNDGKLICVPLKGGTSFPDAARKPVTSTLGLRLPFPSTGNAKTMALEELNVRANLALEQKRFVKELEGNADDLEHEYLVMSAQVDKVTLKLFAAMVDANKLERALDLVDRLHLEQSYDLATRLADRHARLVDFILEAKESKFGGVGDEDSTGTGLPESTFLDRTSNSRQVSPGSGDNKFKRSFGNLGIGNGPLGPGKRTRVGGM
eukprot:Nitzschia sp. Nitz4//scaffold150_size53981//29254//32411//NITZ4_006678-RA/size53981-snap-gene-0.66-mRNA-1//-1//CDS//3329537074//5734//frame0